MQASNNVSQSTYLSRRYQHEQTRLEPNDVRKHFSAQFFSRVTFAYFSIEIISCWCSVSRRSHEKLKPWQQRKRVILNNCTKVGNYLAYKTIWVMISRCSVMFFFLHLLLVLIGTYFLTITR